MCCRELERLPLMKRLYAIVFLLLSGTLYVFNGFEFPREYIVFKAPDGSRDRMSLREKDLNSDSALAVISEIGVPLSVDKRTCDSSARKSPSRLSRQIEAELELRGIIDSLLTHDKPRVLTVTQKQIIEKIPECEPYLDELQVISKLVNGYDLIQRSATMN
jgi:hypothetical protein